MSTSQHWLKIVAALILSGILTGCTGLQPPEVPTLTAEPSRIPTAIIPVTGATFFPRTAPAASATPLPLTSPTPAGNGLLTPSAAPAAAATATPVSELLPTLAQPACNAAQFVTDVSVPPATGFDPGTVFTKTWRLQNIGTCAWTTETSLVFDSGDRLGGPVSDGLPENADPGQTIDVSINLTAPAVSGTYSGQWMLADAKGKRFGLGLDGKTPLTVSINVAAPITQLYDFTSNLCAANWMTPAGAVKCPSAGVDFKNGSERQTTDAHHSPILALAPASGTNGMIKGIYPLIRLDGDDHFQAVIGCASADAQCSLSYRLDVITSGSAVETALQTWKVSGADGLQTVDVDLSPLGVVNVQLALVVTNTNASAAQDEGIWIQPQILD